jgi:hypothetical protein
MSLFENSVSKLHESASEHNFKKFPCVKYKDDLGVVLHKFTIENPAKNKGLYLAFVKITDKNSIDILKQIIKNVENENLLSCMEYGMQVFDDQEIIYLKWSVNNWKKAEYKFAQKKGAEGTWKVNDSTGKDELTVVRALKHLT